ncbi:hypothetical protein [Mycetocola reblochoni]|uniref:hypothetical protein n=1 Tax=Mycetocola reblochoni TaxID=331618 RepID=UPI003F97CD0C
MIDPTISPGPGRVDAPPLRESHDQHADEGRRSDTAASPSSAVAAEEARASEFATHGDPTITRDDPDPVSKRPGVQWVRPTDLAARAGSVVLDRGAELNTRLRDAVLDGVREGRAQLQERLARRQEALDPDGSSPTSALGRGVGRTGVSR